MQLTQNRLLAIFALVIMVVPAQAQFYFGIGGESRQYSADRLKASNNMIVQLGYSWGNFSIVGQTKSSWEEQHWTTPDWIAGGRFEWRPKDLTEIIQLRKEQKLYVLTSIQNTVFRDQPVSSEHLGWFTDDHWKREIYRFQYSRNETLYGVGIEFRNTNFAVQTEFQFGRAPTLDTWVYKSELHLNGNEIVIEDYYYREEYFTSRLSMSIRYFLEKSR